MIICNFQPVPYESGLGGDGLAPGKSLFVYGMPEKKGKRFHINLLKKNGDIALHFNPRFDEKVGFSRKYPPNKIQRFGRL